MTKLEQVYKILTSINGFKTKVAYRCFPEGKAPKLPFICYLADHTNNFSADSKVYETIEHIFVELYTATKDPSSEALVESALNSNEIFWEKSEEYIDSEQCYQILYEIEI